MDLLEEEREEVYLKVFALSFFFHLFLFWMIGKMGEEKTFSDLTKEEIEVAYEEKGKVFIPDFFSPPLLSPKEEDKKSTPFFSHFFRRTKEEFIADQLGAVNFNSPLPGMPGLKGRTQKQKMFLKNLNAKSISSDALSLFSGFPGSTVNLYLPHLKKAYMTVLNTNAYDDRRFYIFFERIFEQVMLRLTSNLTLMSKLISYREIDELRKKHDVIFTKLDFLFDKEGHLKDTKLLQSSGIKELDYIAIDSFEDAAPFLNPPQELVRKEGSFRLGFSFAYILREK